MADRMSSAGTAPEHWIQQQKKSFTTWVNSTLAERSLLLDRDLAVAFDDGLMLIPFIEILTGDKALKHVAKPKMRIQKQENINLAFNLLHAHDFDPDAHVEELLDGNEKMVLGLIWQLFLTFNANDSSAELLAWVQERVNEKERYPGVNVTNFQDCWRDGKAFAALLDSFDPNVVLDFTTVNDGDDEATLNAAFDAANTVLGVPKLLDAQDLIAYTPDDKTVRMYVTLLKNAWAEKEAEVMAAAEAEAAALQAEMDRLNALSKDELVSMLMDANAALNKLKACPECGCDLEAWLAQQQQ